MAPIIFRRSLSRAVLMGATLAYVAFMGAQRAFVQLAGADSVSRKVWLRNVLPAVLGSGAPMAAQAVPNIPERSEYITRRKRELCPIFKQGIDYLETHDVDERMLTFVPRMARQMDVYAGILSESKAPDRITRRLQKDIKTFKEAVENKDKAAALVAWEQYRADIPKGVAEFDTHDTESFEGPKDVDVPGV